MSANSTFEGRVLLIVAKEPAKGAVLENVRVQQLGERAFLVGQLADYGKENPDPRTGMTFWFAVDDVCMLTEYTDLQTARVAHVSRGEAKRQGQRALWVK
jgi:hypothetical protein